MSSASAASSTRSEASSGGSAVSRDHSRQAQPSRPAVRLPGRGQRRRPGWGSGSARVPSTASRDEVEAQRVGAPPPRSTATRSRSIGPLCRGQRGGRGPRRRQRLRGSGEADAAPQLTGPQPLRDLLVGVRARPVLSRRRRGRSSRSAWIRVTPVADPAPARRRRRPAAGRSRAPPPGRPRRPAPRPRRGRRCCPARRPPAAAEQAAADVRVQRLRLHPEPPAASRVLIRPSTEPDQAAPEPVRACPRRRPVMPRRSPDPSRDRIQSCIRQSILINQR